MRRRLKHFIPIVALALLVQIFAPIGACWARALAISDPLSGGAICSGAQSGGSGQSHAHDGCCSLCCASPAVAVLDTPVEQLATPLRIVRRFQWALVSAERLDSRDALAANARAPPAIS